MLYQAYQRLRKNKAFVRGLSNRVIDRGLARWLGQLERAIGLCPQQQRFLDIGAGDGRLTRLLATTYFVQGVAIEIQPPQDTWQELLQACPNVQLLDGLLQDLLPKLSQQEPFDFIVLAEVFEHIPPADVASFLHALRGVVHEQTVIFLTTPNGVVQGPAEQSPIWYQRQPYGHYHHYTKAELQNLLAIHGFCPLWWTFECSWAKSAIYDRFFYPLARWDYVFQNTRRLPGWVRGLYRLCSWPLIFCSGALLHLCARAIAFYEDRWAGQDSGRTMMVTCMPQAQRLSDHQ